MADRVSIAAAIAGLLPVVNGKNTHIRHYTFLKMPPETNSFSPLVEGFVLLRDVFLADRKSRFYLGRIELQRTVRSSLTASSQV
jgi:hypothetical protein